jgi:cobalamin biosynthesis protein CbiG
MIYINGHRASRADLARLLADLKAGKQRATAHTTKNGALAITTEF